MKTFRSASLMGKGHWAAALAVGAFLLSAAHPAAAHKVSVFAWPENGRIVTEGYFTDGTPCRGAEIAVSDAAGNPVAQGKSNDEGIYNFAPPANGGDLTIVLSEPTGHRAEFLLAANEYEEALAGEAASGAASPGPSEAGQTGGEAGGAAEAEPGDLDCAAVRQEMAKLRRQLAKEEAKGPEPAAVAGAVGYFIGALGLWMWRRSLQKPGTESAHV